MTIRKLVIAFCAAGTLAAQTPPPPVPPHAAVHPTFIQMSDPQFGMFTDNKGFEQETANYEFAIATANRLRPQFVIVTGDLVNRDGSADQIAEYKRISAKLDPSIRLFSVPGNHDVGNEPTPQTLATYRERFGPDYYTFRVGELEGIVLNSNLEKGTVHVPEEAARMEKWFEAELKKARDLGVKRVIVFQHISFFLKTPEEPDQYFNIPADVRKRYLKLMHEYGVKDVFCGHLHHNSEGRDGEIDVVTTGPVGKPLGGKSGMRMVTITGEGVQHQFFEFGDLP